MPKLRAYIQWEIEDDSGETVASSYEHISYIDDAYSWAEKMENYLEENEDDN